MEETKIDGQLVLLPGTIKFLPHRLDVVNRCTVQCIRNHMLASYCLEDNNKFPSLSRKNMTGWPQKYNQQLIHPEQLHPSPEVAFNPGKKFGFYDDFYDQVHVDAKCFYVFRRFKQRFVLTESEGPPCFTGSNTRII